MQNIYEIEILSYARRVLIYYALTVVIYGVITYFVSTYRYARAKKSLKLYYHNLKKLNSLYDR